MLREIFISIIITSIVFVFAESFLAVWEEEKEKKDSGY